MHENLENYLKEVSHYLAVKRGAEEILAEIRSHILEKAESEAGEITEASLQRAIGEYGRPREVAAKYMEGREIISPIFRKHLFRYTAILFAVHFILIVLAVHFSVSMVAFPFIFIPKMGVLWAVFYTPMALVYDFGVVALILYLVTQRKGEVRLPWIGLSLGRRGESGLGRPKPAVLVMLIGIFALLLLSLGKYHTIFFYSVNMSRPESLFNAASSIFISIMVLAALACDIMAYSIRFLFNSAWVTLVENGVVLLILWSILNSPIKLELKTIRGFDVKPAVEVLVLFWIVWSVLRFLRSLVGVVREMSRPW